MVHFVFTDLRIELKAQLCYQIQLAKQQSKQMYAAIVSPSHLRMDLMHLAMDNILHRFSCYKINRKKVKY